MHLGKWQVKTKDRRAGRKPSVIIISPKFITYPRRRQAKYGLNVSRGYEACSGATWQEEGGSRVWGSGGDRGGGLEARNEVVPQEHFLNDFFQPSPPKTLKPRQPSLGWKWENLPSTTAARKSSHAFPVTNEQAACCARQWDVWFPDETSKKLGGCVRRGAGEFFKGQRCVFVLKT